MDWIGAATGATQVLAAGTRNAQYLVLPSELQAQFTDPTLMRTVAQADIRSLVAGTIFGAVGIITWDDVNDTPPAAGEAPGPFANPNADWLWHSYFFNANGGLVVQATFSDGFATRADSKARRRLGTHRGILMVVENSSLSGQAISCLFGGRCLIKD